MSERTLYTQRVGAAIVDCLIVVAFLLIFLHIIQDFILFEKVGMIIGNAYLLFKDFLFGNASIGKKVCGVQIVCENGDKKVPARALILRNLILAVLFPFEFGKIVVDRYDTRYGDKVTHTRVVLVEKSHEE